MSENSDKIVIRNILVALDTSRHSWAALEAAATLARMMEASIEGIYVEDSDWIRLSKLPLIKEVNELTGDINPLAEQQIDHQIKLIEQRIQKQLKQITRLKEVKHTWKTVKGSVEEQVLKAARNSDLITIGRKGHSYFRHKQLGRTAKYIVEKAEKPVLILQEGLSLGDTVVTVFDASIESRKSMRMALAIAEKNDSTLTVIIIGTDRQTLEKRYEEMKKDFLGNTAVKTNVTLLERSNIWEFMNLVNSSNGGLLIIPRNQPFMKNRSLELLLNHVGCPVLLMAGN